MFIICYVVHLKLIFFPVPHNLISRKTEQVLDLGRFREEHDLHFANILDRSSEETKIKELTRTMTHSIFRLSCRLKEGRRFVAPRWLATWGDSGSQRP